MENGAHIGTSGGREEAAPDLRINRPHSARMYDYYLGGKTNYAADRQAAVKVLEAYPSALLAARHNRDFMRRATRVLAREHGLRQWLDIGTGIPTAPNLHQVAQSVAPEARVVYVDNDPIVLTYARALLTSSPEGATAYVESDVRDPEAILASPELRETLDLTRPVVLSLNAILHFVADSDDPYGLVERLLAPLPSGSVLALSHGTPDFAPEEMARVQRVYAEGGTHVAVRTREEVLRFFDGLELMEPGLVTSWAWRPEEDENPVRPGMVSDAEVGVYVGVAFKP